MRKNIKECFEEFQEDFQQIEDRQLPFHDHSTEIKKSDAWIVWLCNEERNITDLQVYDFQHESYLEDNYCPRKKKIPEYVDMHMKGIPYRDCGCVNADWNEWDLKDIYFKFGIQYGFLNREIMIKCMHRLSYIDEFRENILKHLKYL